jgi:single-stranded DNA-binding protein
MSGASRRAAATAFGAMNQPPEMMATKKQPSATGKPAEHFGNLVKKRQEIFVDGKLRMDEWTDKQTNTRRTRLYLLVENWQFTQYRRNEESTPAPSPVAADTKKAKKGTK